ncbi:hypothetical protein QBC40DRAFT_346696 [Triangularia verruculosa]|uniref:Uncharacterized protein n=1 Tax=Triangularia verruculosa TaxID=2587418 RepID=A0AAN6XNT5_9PEZI|nr:hypothetical protein QBC40DRAFT_346696 [Triangularia verruculosa]
MQVQIKISGTGSCTSSGNMVDKRIYRVPEAQAKERRTRAKSAEARAKGTEARAKGRQAAPKDWAGGTELRSVAGQRCKAYWVCYLSMVSDHNSAIQRVVGSPLLQKFAEPSASTVAAPGDRSSITRLACKGSLASGVCGKSVDNAYAVGEFPQEIVGSVKTRKASGWKRHRPGLDVGSDERFSRAIFNGDVKLSTPKVDRVELKERLRGMPRWSGRLAARTNRRSTSGISTQAAPASDLLRPSCLRGEARILDHLRSGPLRSRPNSNHTFQARSFYDTHLRGQSHLHT